MDVKHGVDEKTRAQLPAPQPKRTPGRLSKAWAINLLFVVYCAVSYTVKTYHSPSDITEHSWAFDVARTDGSLSSDKVEELFL